MKVRGSFVANSSSSSFIIGSPFEIADADDLKQHWLQGRTDGIPKPYEVGGYEVDELAKYLERSFERKWIKFDQLDEIIDAHLASYFPDTEKMDQILDMIVSKIAYYIGRQSTQEMYAAYEKKFGCSYYGSGDKVSFQDSLQFQADWVREKHGAEIREAVYKKVEELKQFPFHYIAEFSDDCSYEAGIEHNDVLWTLVPYCIRISHH